MRALLALGLVLAAGCGGNEHAGGVAAPNGPATESVAAPGTAADDASETAMYPAVEEERDGGCTSGATVEIAGDGAWAVVARNRVRAFARPHQGTLDVFEAKTSLGAPTVFAVRRVVVDRRCHPIWYHVQLPMRPNGKTGYVPASAVTPFKVTTRIVVDLSERSLRLFRGGRRVLATPVAVGSSATPTPTGTYYVNQKVRVTDTHGPFGPAALGISAFSPVLTGWAEGGPVAIHGTNDPSSIGSAVSNGCVRVPNERLLRLYHATDPGTPVVIRA